MLAKELWLWSSLVAHRSSLAEQTPRPASANANRDVSSPLLDPLSQDLWSRYTRSRDIDLLSFIQYRSMPKLPFPLPLPVHPQPSSRALSRFSLTAANQKPDQPTAHSPA